ncbi:PKD domain-containing protein [Haloarchaeobius amylolyticus]|uniref:PKD domain-containing protein n=1 Tax=Haloarchaeobius amylolyticus TaxID=1198296 RepID=UPI0022720C3B
MTGLVAATAGVAGVGGGTAPENGGSTTGGDAAGGGVADAAAQTANRQQFDILEGTDLQTTVYVRTAEADGPTVFVVGGVHGDEESGYRTADAVTEWEVDAGQLVVLPRANQPAVESGTRTGGIGDLNRQFPAGEEPTSELARAIWSVITEYDPDVLVDLHQADSIYTPGQEGPEKDVGQAIFHSGGNAGGYATEMAAQVNENVVPDSRPRYDFLTAMFDFEMEPSGLLATKAATALDSDSLLVEVTDEDLALETQVAWQTALVRVLLSGLVIADGEGEDGEEPEPENEPPVAVLETMPADAESVDFERGDTVTFDASRSSDPDGEVATYEWSLDGESFREGDATAELTFNECGTAEVKVRVTDDDGATDTVAVTVSTKDRD